MLQKKMLVGIVIISILLALSGCKLTNGIPEASLRIYNSVEEGETPACPRGLSAVINVDEYEFIAPPVLPGEFWSSHPVYPEYGQEFLLTVVCYKSQTELTSSQILGSVPSDPAWTGILITTRFEGRNCQNEPSDPFCVEF